MRPGRLPLTLHAGLVMWLVCCACSDSRARARAGGSAGLGLLAPDTRQRSAAQLACRPVISAEELKQVGDDAENQCRPQRAEVRLNSVDEPEIVAECAKGGSLRVVMAAQLNRVCDSPSGYFVISVGIVEGPNERSLYQLDVRRYALLRGSQGAK